MSQPGILLFIGPDRPTKLQRLQALERSLGIHAFDRHRLDAHASIGPELVALCRQRPAASRLRLVVVEEAHRLDEAAVRALTAQASLIAQTSCVVLLVDVPLTERHALQRGGGALTTEQFPARDTASAKPFAFVEAIGRRDVAGALGAAHEQLRAGREPLELVGLIGWQLQRWVVVRRLLAAGGRQDAALASIGLRDWQLERVKSEIRDRSLASLQQLLERCWELDVGAKSGKLAPLAALEQLVIEICLVEPGRAESPSGLGPGTKRPQLPAA